MIRKLAVFTTLVILLAMRVEASEIPVNHVKDKIVKHSVEMGVDPALALSLAKAESGYSHSSRSPYGAVGVFQLMPATAKKLGVNPYHLDGNIRGGLMYYKMLYKMFGSQELALAAYHTGPAYVLKYKKPAPCSKRYISAIMQDYYRMKAHTDPSIQRHNSQVELAKKQAEAKARAEAKAKAEAAKAQAEAADKANGLHEADAKTREHTSSEV
ncbi:MAG: transglycosylase SLT domain-containing protein [Cyanobacteria bacterium RUI128]|nr:transglycosylase SLT domain-containing protein [Cyanobacteria bacterium RUI128]